MDSPTLQRRNLGTQRRIHLPVHSAPFLDREDVRPQRSFQKILVSFDNLRLLAQIGDAGIRRRKQMIVNFQRIVRAEKSRAEIIRSLQRHMASRAVQLRFRRIIERPGIMAGHTAEQVGIVMILPAQPFLVMIQLAGNAHLMASRAEFSRLVMWL